ncbi:MAG TPA: ATP-binding protein [Brevundimonas sp.]|uniref:ATP-binding protein n=1 Tax=Brevundimonas sp. TaxID=1871086 RepID=UPI002BE87C34|nr:ATP-binding protein [Brevundimonas sp.]HRH19203.1 ATP-binding protein [Brevundimonas sp.]
MASGASTSARLWTRVLRRQLPTSLWGRALLIIVLPIALMQVAVTWAFFEAHWETVTARLSEGLAGDVAWAVDSYLDEPTPEHLVEITDQAQIMQLSVALREGGTLPTRDRPAFFVALDRSLDNALSDRLDPQPFWFDTTRYPNHVEIQVQVEAGVLRFIAPRERAFATRGHIFILWLGGATILLTAIAIVFIRNQVRAIERLADAAEAFGKGEEDVAFKPHGAREVRRAATAFLSMRERIQRYIDQRTILLASVSHDLRTPLTRLKLELALAEPSTRTDAMSRDLSEMEHMIDEYLAFAEGEVGELPVTVDVTALAETAAADARRLGADVLLELESGLDLIARFGALRRALTNLVDNAASHGRAVRISSRTLKSGGVEIAVEDDGPGIEPDSYDEAFMPFSRLDPSRNQNRKGVGLGLAIARDLVRSHGGDITLDRSDLGGLKAVIRLPR